jgi:leucyl aminopeptidase
VRRVAAWTPRRAGGCAISASHVLLTGMGPAKQLHRRSWRKAWSTAAGALLRTRIASCAVALDRPEVKELDDYYLGRAVAELTGAALYRINDLKTARKPPPHALKKVLAGPVRRAAAGQRGLAHGEAVAAAQSVQRDLANLPANTCAREAPREPARARTR